MKTIVDPDQIDTYRDVDGKHVIMFCKFRGIIEARLTDSQLDELITKLSQKKHKLRTLKE